MITRDRQTFDEQTLPNGVRTYVYTDQSRYSIATITVPVGSASSFGEYAAGTFHFLEHMLYNRSKAYPALNQYRKVVGLKGGTFSASTAPFYTRYVLQVPTIHFAVLWPGLFSAVFQPSFETNDLEVERGTISSERQRKERWFPGGSELEQYMDTKWMRNVALTLEQRLGSEDSLAAIDVASLEAAHSSSYFSEGLQMLAGGSADFKPLIASLAGLSIHGAPPARRVAQTNWVNQKYHVQPFRDVGRHVLRFGGIISEQPEPLRNRARSFILEYLTNPTHGALFKWLREERGWAYDLGYSNGLNSSGESLWTLRLPLGTQEQVDIVREELMARIDTALHNTKALNDEVSRLVAMADAYWYPEIAPIVNEAFLSLENFGRIFTEQEYLERFEHFRDSTFLTNVWKEATAPENVGSFCATPSL